ncbi:MAG: hypothetical protein DI628_08355 [Blastochloris viridis]|uniref:SH3b domain-containing protein n=1 Tax=Blastochloris viridis TaxID=1079 RepID=A0A6N4R0I5_BLAVI|nr:MAG: hypothetical protein DI628_08355 [Blastochloris viridis]
MMMRLVASLVVASVAGAVQAQDLAAPVNSPFPWYGSLKKNEVNVRSGPGNQYPILWVYQRAGYPVEVMARYDNYYKLRDIEGEEGWVYLGMVSRKPTALVGGKTPANLSRSSSIGSPLVARLAPGVVVELDKCEDVAEAGTLCKVEAPGASGWVNKRNLEMVK